MGNKHTEGVDVINPRETPYLHIIAVNGHYVYIPSIGTEMVVTIHSQNKHSSKSGILSYFCNPFGGNNPDFEDNPLERMVFELLPEITDVPPAPVYVASHIQNAVDKFIPLLLSALENIPHASLVAVSHGRMWGLAPEEAIADRLRLAGYSAASSFYEVGGRKRIQTNAISIVR